MKFILIKLWSTLSINQFEFNYIKIDSLYNMFLYNDESSQKNILNLFNYYKQPLIDCDTICDLICCRYLFYS